MSKTTKAILLAVSLTIALLTVVGGLGVKAANNDSAYRQLEVYTEVLQRIRTEYVEEPNIANVTDGALHGLLESLDANSSYLSPAQYKDYRAISSSAKGEVGAAISKRFGYAAVISVIPGGPGDKAGIESGDIIEAIQGKSTRELSLAEINAMLAGQPGSNVTLEIVRARRSEPLKVTLTRDTVEIPPVATQVLDQQIGYVKVDAIVKGKAPEIASKIKALQRQGVKKLILDVRDCGDGDEQEGVAVANLFLNHGVIAYLEGQRYPRQTFNADPVKAITNLPLVVLVNRGTAGAAEIVAGAVLENARGDVLGDKTFGAGSVQKVIEIPDGSALILSVAKYYTPNGKAIQDAAITPNITVADNQDDLIIPDDEDNVQPDQELKRTERPPQQDEQLRRAIEVLRNRPA